MKSKRLLLMLLIALIAPWAANAQETSLTVCDGTATSSYAPIKSGGGSQTEFIYPATLLGDMEGGTITSVKFFSSSTSTTNYSSTVTVYVQEVAETTETTSAWRYSQNDATKVYEGTTLSVTGGELVINFSTPYEYNGGNLCFNIWSASNTPTVSYYYLSTSSACGYDYYITPPVSNPYSTGAYLPKAEFTYTPGAAPSCPKPTNLTVSNVTSSNASFSWTKGGDETEWVLEYSTNANFTDAVSVSPSGIPALAINDFAPATTYYARVKALCGGGDESNWSNVVSFTTLCEAITTYPWTENFDSYTGTTSGSTNNLPQCYNYINGTTYSYYAGYPVIYNGSSNSANNHLYLYSYYYSSYTYTPIYAILPVMEGLNGKQLTLYAKAYNANSSFTVGMMTDPTDASTFVAIDTKTPSTSIYEEFTFTLGEGNYVAFKMEPANSSSTYRGIRIDDIIIDNPPTCAKPTDLQHTGSTTTTATLSWTNGAEGQTAWQICLNGNENNLIMANSNPFTIEDLTASSVYTAKVRAYCSATDQSYWSNEISFATECDAISTLPWRENFDAYTGATSTSAPTGYPNDQLPNCWQFLNRSETTSDYPQAFLTSSTTYAVSGNCLFFKSSSTTPLYAILPGFAEEIAGLQLTFTYRNEGTGTSNGQLIAGYMTNPADATTFVEVLTCDRTTTLTEKEVLFADAPAGSYIAFKYQGGSANNYYLSIDNVSVDYAPSCPKPQSLAVTANSVTAHGAIVTWTEAGEATQWIVEFATDANFTDVLNETANDAPTYTFHGLDPETQYYVRVKAHCGAGNESQYSNVVNFTTDAACKVPTSLTVSNVTVNTATLSWTENGESTSWQICLNDDEDNLINATETTWTLENLTAETVYTAKVRGICNDEPTGWSSSVSFEPTAKLVIGSGTGTTGYLPSNTNYDFSYTQQIYTVAELGEAGVIESIDFYMTSTQDYERNLDIYMVSTDKESFANNTDWIAVTNADLVFSGNVNFTAQSWTTITLDESFIYNGTQNVAIIVDDNTEEWSSRNFRSFTVESNQAHYCYQDNTNINPSAPSASNNSVTTSKNQIRILKSELSDCMKPTQFAATEVGPDFAILDWTENGASESWYIFYEETNNPGEEFIEVFEHPYTLTGLHNETPYSVFVVPSCGFVEEDVDNNLMSHTIEFTTLPGCPAPQNVEVSDITNSSVVVTWTGFNDSYKVIIDNNSGFTETYENAESPLTIENLEGNTPYLMTVVGLCGETVEMEADPVVFVTKCDLVTEFPWSENFEDYEASSSGVTFSDPCWENIHLAGTGTYFFEVYSGTNGTNETNQLRLHDMNDGTMTKLMLPGMNLPNANYCFSIEVYRSTSYTSKTGEGIRVFASANGEIEGATELAFIPRLYSVESGVIPAEETGNQWYTYNLPIGMSGTCYIILRGESQYGAATYMDNFEVKEMPTFTKTIEAYDETNDKGWYLIASPLADDVNLNDVTGLTNETFRLYRFNQNAESEWEYYDGTNNPFNSLVNGTGYLYANTTGDDLIFTGAAYSGNGAVSVVFDGDAEFAGWNLIGNPFGTDAYLVDDENQGLAYIRMNSAGNGFVQVADNSAIAKMEGVFYQATAAGTVYFSTEAPGANSGNLNMTVSQGRGTKDNAIIRFGEGNTMEKFSFREGSTKVYIPQDGKDYAVVNAEEQGEKPVSFKAEENGTYTLSFNAEEVTFSYLHLIDNMTGMDVDLLAATSTGSVATYTFDARTTDYSSRFKLVFATGSNNDSDNFAFYSNGNWIIGNEGEATLQVIDVTGRVLSSETVNGSVSKAINAAPGVYMLRLINGENVKVQKIVVR